MKTLRFFKLIYIFALIAIALSLPVYLLSSIQSDKVYITSYKARCLTNNEFVVLQGSPNNLAYVFDEVSYNDATFGNLKKDLNFYCKYWDEIQQHVIIYNRAQTIEEQVRANQNYFIFQQKFIDLVSEYPKLYELVITNKEFQPYGIYGPVVGWFTGAIMAFILLQLVRMSYVYIAFGKIVWHPFKLGKIEVEQDK